MNTKSIERIGTISANALRQMLISAYNIAVPFLVLHFASKEIWGSFVKLLLFSLAALQLVNWGNKEYQLRHFSQSPGSISKNYSTCLATRSVWLPVFSVAALCWFPVWQAVFIVLWIFGRYLSQSTDALIIYEKKFNAAIAIETGCFFVFCAAFLLLKDRMDTTCLLVLYSCYQLIKGLAYSAFFRDFLSIADIRIDWIYFQGAMPFFLLSVLGFLASKVDVYLIALMKDRIVTADYQVVNSLLVFIMSLSAFVYAPFTKNIYRNTAAVIEKTQRTLLISGLLVVPVSLVAFAIIIRYYLQLDFGGWFYAVAFCYVFPAFAYGIDVVNFFRIGREKTVVRYLFAGATINSVLSAALIYLGFGIPGALTGSAIAQLIVLLLFKLNHRDK